MQVNAFPLDSGYSPDLSLGNIGSLPLYRKPRKGGRSDFNVLTIGKTAWNLVLETGISLGGKYQMDKVRTC